MHRSDFCLAGMFRDLFLFRNSPLLRSLVLLIACTMLLFEAARLLGLLSFSLPSSLFGLPSLTNLLGGLLFGIGMVLAGGCVIGTLYKVGAGNFPSACAFLGLIIGSTLYAEFHPQWKQLETQTRFTDAATLPQLIGLSQSSACFVVLAIFGGFLFRWHQNGLLRRPSVVKGYLQPQTAALLLAVIGLVSFSLTGMPLGITTSYVKVGAFFEQLIIPEHFANLSYFQGQEFQYLSPLSGQTLNAGAGPFWDGLSLVQFPLIGGIFVGSALSAISMGKFLLRFNIPKVQLISALFGGVLMGFAARMAPACNVWHLLGGLPLLSLQSILFTIGLLPGALIGSHLLTRYVLTP
ncbi:YeeE/YedE thiosulfate transporter family protein [Malonomonas rubra]|uniref:YeeE/YedE thiosulfate transporter family protein n=1 Tax=Malonomonas rubra TaxID=57040 RepID=UPI0026EB82C1|nr:YeeE/YedE thiosulfate transporter family protein [Malonomonas rubra]